MYIYIARCSMHEDYRAHFPEISKQKQKNSRSRTKLSISRMYWRELSKASSTVTTHNKVSSEQTFFVFFEETHLHKRARAPSQTPP